MDCGHLRRRCSFHGAVTSEQQLEDETREDSCIRDAVHRQFSREPGPPVGAGISRSSGLKPGDEFRGSLAENILKNANPIKEPRSCEDAAASFSSGLDVNPPSFHLFKTSPAPPKNTLLTGFFFEERN